MAYIETSALAKWYINEDNSEEVEAYLTELDERVISSLAIVEMRWLLIRRREAEQLTGEMASNVLATFHDDIARHHLSRLPVEDDVVLSASSLMGSLSHHATSSLVWMHLNMAQHYGIEEVATADKPMAKAAEELGMKVAFFGSS